MEIIPLQRGRAGANDASPTAFWLEAEAAHVDIESKSEVAAFVGAAIEREGINVDAFQRVFSEAWGRHEEYAAKTFGRMFETSWTPGHVTAYLTLSQRCPYSYPDRYYFASMTSPRLRIVTNSLHELMHFYSHRFLEPEFAIDGVGDRHQDFKEALTVLLNEEFADIMESPDRGYPQHQELRDWILEEYQGGASVYAIAESYISDVKH